MNDTHAAFKKPRIGQFVQKVQDDQGPNLTVLLGRGTLNTLHCSSASWRWPGSCFAIRNAPTRSPAHR